MTWGKVWQAGVNPAGLLEFAKLGLPGGGMMALDAGSWDITTAMAGFLGTVAVDAHTTLLNVCICSFMAAVFGVATAASIRVGNMLGAGRYRLARLSGNLSIGMAMFNMVLVSILIFSTRNVLGLLFVDDDEVVALVAKVAWLAALYQPADGLFGASSGVLRGLGVPAVPHGEQPGGLLAGGNDLCGAAGLQRGPGYRGSLDRDHPGGTHIRFPQHHCPSKSQLEERVGNSQGGNPEGHS
eukprot:jgi/Botrbrau1/16534/Bobra.0327s0003.1